MIMCMIPFIRNVFDKQISPHKANQCPPGAGGGSRDPLQIGMRELSRVMKIFYIGIAVAVA